MLPIAQNQALFSLYGTMYGGDGRTTFGLPDFRGRVPVGTGRGPGLDEKLLGSRGGANEIQLHERNVPASVVDIKGYEVNPNDPDSKYVSGNRSVVVVGNSPNVTIKSNSTYKTSEVNNMQPYLGMNYIICLEGEYPVRN